MRQKSISTYQVNDRTVVVTAYDSIGVEDVMDIGLRAALHRIKTGEDLWEPASREIKDWILKSNLFV